MPDCDCSLCRYAPATLKYFVPEHRNGVPTGTVWQMPAKLYEQLGRPLYYESKA